MTDNRIHRIYRFFQSRFRPARMRAFLDCFSPTSDTTIVDVGGTVSFWAGQPGSLNVTLVNTGPEPPSRSQNISYVRASATELPFADQSVDVVFSNSMIEHLGSWGNQVAFAREAHRVGRGVWVQTPARWFPIEPHVLTPFVHYLPAWARRRVLRNFTFWGLITRPSQAYVDRIVDEISLLSARQMRTLFPGCELRRERVMGLTKSLIAVKPPV